MRRVGWTFTDSQLEEGLRWYESAPIQVQACILRLCSTTKLRNIPGVVDTPEAAVDDLLLLGQGDLVGRGGSDAE